MEEPRVSIMLVSYNHEKYIQRALDSALGQTYQDFEIVLSDDGSTDRTKEVLSGYQDPRISMHFFEENQGATINHRYVWKQCRGEYLALLNSDDVWLGQHLEKSVDYLDRHKGCAAVFSWAALIDENDQILEPCCEVFRQQNRTQAEWVHHLFTKGNCICHPSMVIRREVYGQVGFYKLGFRQLPDFNMWVRMIKKNSIHILEEVLVQHRRFMATGQNTSAPVLENSVRDVNESFYTLLHYFDDLPDELFCEAFRQEFRKKDAASGAELLCEKFFLMYDEKYYMHPISKFASFLFLHEIYDREHVWKVLKEEYGFRLQDVHALGQEYDLIGLRECRAVPEKTKQVILDKPSFWQRLKMGRF